MDSPRARVYLDHNATAPLRTEAREAMASALERCCGNPSSPHAGGHEARVVLEQARDEVARLAGARPAEIVFVSGGTEADNLAIQGVARARHAGGGAPGHIITSAVEHPAVLETCRYLETTGWRVTVLDVDGQGLVDPDDMVRHLRPDTVLVSIMAANNETGVIQPLSEVARATRAAGVALHVDAVQAAGRIDLDAAISGADLMSLSSHKMGGPAGIGALCVREATPLAPILLGGGQERRRRPGTEAPVLAAGFAAAARAALERDDRAGVERLRDRMEGALRDRLGEAAAASERCSINGARAPRLPNTSSLALDGIDAETLVIRMDLMGFAISTGSACSTGSARPSHVLAAMGLPASAIASTIRVSLGPSNTSGEIEAFVDCLTGVVREMERCVPAAPGRGGR